MRSFFLFFFFRFFSSTQAVLLFFVFFLSFFFSPSRVPSLFHWPARGRETELGSRSRQVGPRFGKPGVADLGGGNPFSTREKDDLQSSFSTPLVWFFLSLSLSFARLISLPSSNYYTTSSLIRSFFLTQSFVSFCAYYCVDSSSFLRVMVPFFFLTA